MNRSLTPEQIDDCLFSLGRALVMARAAMAAKDVEQAHAIVDAFHNLPRLLLGARPEDKEEWHVSWTVDYHNEIFLKGLLEKYPHLSGTGLDRTLTVSR